MSSFRSLTWTVVVLAAIVLVACDSKGTSADTGNGPATTLDAAGMSAAGMTSTTLVDFDDAVAELDRSIEEAEGDLCELVAVTSRPLTVSPETEEQAHQVVDAIVKMVKAMGDVADPADAEVYEDAAERLRDAAEAKGFSPEWLSSPETFKALDAPEFSEAALRLQQRYQAECTSTTTTAG